MCAATARRSARSPVAYRTTDGHEFRRHFDVDELPALWPRQAGGSPEMVDHSPGQLQLSAAGWNVFVNASDNFTHATFVPLPGSVLGRPHGIGLRRQDWGWNAWAACGSSSVHVHVDGRGRAARTTRP